MKKRVVIIFSLIILMMIVISLIQAFLPTKSRIELPNNVPNYTRIRDTVKNNEIILSEENTIQLIKLINNSEYISTNNAPNGGEGKVIYITIDIDLSKLVTKIDSRKMNYPVMIVLFEKNLNKSYIRFNDMKTQELRNFVLEEEKITQLYNFYLTYVEQ